MNDLLGIAAADQEAEPLLSVLLFQHCDDPDIGPASPHSPVQSDLQSLPIVQGGVQLPVYLLHHRQFLHPCGQGLVGHREQARVLYRAGRVGAEGAEQSLVLVVKGLSIPPVQDLQDADNLPVGRQRDAEQRPGGKAVAAVGLRIPAGVLVGIGHPGRAAFPDNPSGDPGPGRKPGPLQSVHPDSDLEDEVAGGLVHQQKGSGLRVEQVGRSLNGEVEDGVQVQSRGQQLAHFVKPFQSAGPFLSLLDPLNPFHRGDDLGGKGLQEPDVPGPEPLQPGRADDEPAPAAQRDEERLGRGAASLSSSPSRSAGR